MRQKEGIYMTHFYIIRHGETLLDMEKQYLIAKVVFKDGVIHR